MTSVFKKMICRFMAIVIMVAPFQTVQAGMIGTDAVNAAATVQADRAVVVNYLTRAQTVSEFQSLGMDPQQAVERVGAMTDAEVGALAGKINTAPAGGLVTLILVVFLIWYFAFRT
jgi:hypothetical protein